MSGLIILNGPRHNDVLCRICNIWPWNPSHYHRYYCFKNFRKESKTKELLEEQRELEEAVDSQAIGSRMSVVEVEAAVVEDNNRGLQNPGIVYGSR